MKSNGFGCGAEEKNRPLRFSEEPKRSKRKVKITAKPRKDIKMVFTAKEHEVL